MKTKNSTTSASGNVENGNYTVELWGASKTGQGLLSAARLTTLHFNQDGIKRSRVAQVGEFFRGENVNITLPRRELGPVQASTDDARLHRAIHPSLQEDFS